MTDGSVIAVIGGTGNEGRGLALKWAKAGRRIIIGSRDEERAAETARSLSGDVSGMSNKKAAMEADIVVLAVPFSAQKSTLESIKDELKGKILVDVTVPLVPPKVSRVQLPEGGSAVLAMQKLLGEDVKVVSAFQNISAEVLLDENAEGECDVLVCGDDPDAREIVVGLAQAAGLKAWHAGPLANSAAAEAMTSILIFINRKYGSTHAGIRITGVEE